MQKFVSEQLMPAPSISADFGKQCGKSRIIERFVGQTRIIINRHGISTVAYGIMEDYNAVRVGRNVVVFMGFNKKEYLSGVVTLRGQKLKSIYS